MISLEEKLCIIIAGVGKAGTTSLFNYLEQHEKICSSSIKEVGFFSSIISPDDNNKPLEEYLSYFSQCQNRPILLEASPGYFYGKAETAYRIKNQIPNPRIIIIFREPIKRLFSYYNFYKSRLALDNNLTFKNYINNSMNIRQEDIFLPKNKPYRGLFECKYDLFLEDWLKVFEKDEMKILFFEDLFNNLRPSLIKICEWADIPSDNYLEHVDLSIANKTRSYNSKILQKIGIHTNRKAERFWRKNPELKKILRRIYYSINGSDFTETIDPEVNIALEGLFATHMYNFKATLFKYGYSNYPKWLNNYS